MLTALPALVVRALLLVAAVLVPQLLPAGLPVRLDLVLLVAVAAGLTHGPGTGGLVGLAGGWLLDLVPPGGDPLGATALTHLAAGVLAGAMRPWTRWSPLAYLLATAAGCLVVFGVRGVASAAGIGVTHPEELLGSAVLTLAVGVLLVPALLALETALRGLRDDSHR